MSSNVRMPEAKVSPWACLSVSMRVSPFCPLLSRSRLSRRGRLPFRPWPSLRRLVRSFGTVHPIFPIVGNLNYIANPGLASILDSTGPLALLVTSPKNIGK
jgi:hypothetical protein